ncbi:MAG: PfkB family carbohydrate kinase [Gammaproteobacteria bacterium]|nr:PfkB family carbohydrate kinase [Gammaproteobacteria bacterium]
MAKILLTGIITLDIINYIDQYPAENMEIRAHGQQLSFGGNAHNTAQVLSQYQHQCYLASTIADDASGALITTHLDEQGINYHPSFIVQNSHTPTSYITLSKSTGSRTIVHYRDLAELSIDQFTQLDLSQFDWFHFEGRNIEQTLSMLNLARRFNKNISIEAEKDRPGIEQLFPIGDVIFFSRPYAEATGFTTAKECLLHYANIYPDKRLSCTWGSDGAWAIAHGQLLHCPAYNAGKIVDTLAAGDTYNAAMIHALGQGLDIRQALQQSCELAAKKCTQFGINKLVI